MELFTSLTQQLATVRQLLGEVPEASAIPALVRRLPDDEVLAVLETAAEVMRSVERLQLAASGVVAERSTRASGHTGLAQSRGHRNPASLVQQITGASRAEAAREVRVGESLLAPLVGAGAGEDSELRPGTDSGQNPELGTDSGATAGGAASPDPWHSPLRAALLDSRLSSPQVDAIRQGLGEPPVPEEPALSLAEREQTAEAVAEAWRLAAQELVREAQHRTVEELRQAARAVRDMLDPVGAEQRAQARYKARSFRLWRDAEGTFRGSFVFDDEAGAWVRHLIDAALRPRRGGPRFVDPAEKAEAEALIADPRSNEQLMHDLLIDVLRSGTLADAEQVMGARQAGVRVVTVVDREPRERAAGAGVTFLEEDGIVVGGHLADRQGCDSGVVPVSVDRRGNPLNVGREQRLFTGRQRIALSLRDGGCRWYNCDRVASYCEAHHIDEWAADRGRTDIERGILLCRFHHMQLHNGGWRITRDGDGPFVLHGRQGEVVLLPPRTARSAAWNLGGLAPPAARFRPQPAPPPGTLPGTGKDGSLGTPVEVPTVLLRGSAIGAPTGAATGAAIGTPAGATPGAITGAPPGSSLSTPPGHFPSSPPGSRAPTRSEISPSAPPSSSPGALPGTSSDAPPGTGSPIPEQ